MSRDTHVSALTDADAAFRADMVLDFLRAQGDLATEIALLADATSYDNRHPGEPSLAQEMCAATSGDPLEVAA